MHTPRKSRTKVRREKIFWPKLFYSLTPALVIFVTGVLILWAAPAGAQSFSCAQAESPAEFAVCNNEELLVLDEKLEVLFTRDIASAPTNPQRQSAGRDHANWLLKRNACGADFVCLKLRYKQRIHEVLKAT